MDFLDVYSIANTASNEEESTNFPAYIDGVDDEANYIAPFITTTPNSIIKALKRANIGPGDRIVDLGSGDGRFIVAAAQKFGVEFGLGVELDSTLIPLARERAMQCGVNDRVMFVNEDLFAVDLKRIWAENKNNYAKIMDNETRKVLQKTPPNDTTLPFNYIVVYLLKDAEERVMKEVLLKWYEAGATIISVVFSLDGLRLVDEVDRLFIYRKE